MSRRKLSYYPYGPFVQPDSDDVRDDSEPQPFSFSSIPWRAVSLAIFLFTLGLVMLVTGCLIFGGVLDSMYRDRVWPLITLGGLMFIPGFYHVRIAYYAYYRIPGFSFEDIPEFE